ncbi:MAG: DUF1559 domain-containing protein [Planctomycetota bacterium]
MKHIPSSRRAKRCGIFPRGFTLVELLAVIAIIGTLVGLLLPAVQAAREASRQSTCMNNIKQLGIGLHAYHDARRKLPPGSTTSKSGQGPDGFSFLMLITPYLENRRLYDAVDLTKSWTNNANYNVAKNAPLVPEYVCPSARYRTQPWPSDFATGSNTAGVTHYYGIMGPLGTKPNGTAYRSGAGTTGCQPTGSGGTVVPSASYETKYGGIACDGMLPNYIERKFSDVTDGLSKTFLVGEISWTQGETQSTNPYRIWSAGLCTASTGGTHWYQSFSTKVMNSQLFELSYDSSVTANTHANDLSFGSEHGGRNGTNFLLGDGGCAVCDERRHRGCAAVHVQRERWRTGGRRMMPIPTPRSILLVVASAVLVVVGCRPVEEPARYRVHGRVTFDGKPVPTGRIVFSSDAAAGFTGKDGWAPIAAGTFDTASGGYGTAGGSLVARVEGGEIPTAQLPEGRLLFSEFEVPVVVSGSSTELNVAIPRSAGGTNAAPDR